MRSLLLLACVAFITPLAAAGGVRIVEPTGTQNFANIASAVAAAAEGDVILVGDGVYSGFSIGAKSLSIFAVPGATVRTGSILVSGLSGSQVVVLSGIDATASSSVPALSISGCSGQVRVERGAFKSYDYDNGGWCPGPLLVGQPGVRVASSSRVAFVDCTFTGGHGQGRDPFEDYCTPPRDGGAGIEASGSVVVAYGCMATGGEGGGSESGGARGGDGIKSSSSTVFASASQFQGGAGGRNIFLVSPPPCGGTGGDGSALSNGSVLYGLACTFQGGAAGYFPCGSAGMPTSGGAVTSLTGPARTASITPSVAGDLGAWSVVFLGASGDQVYQLASLPPGFQIALPFHGAWLALRSALLASQFVGVAGASGAVSASTPMPDLPPGSLYERRFAQVATRTAGAVHLASGYVLLLLDRDSGPDCDGDGVCDYVQVIETPGLDANHNLIPDLCPGG